MKENYKWNNLTDKQSAVLSATSKIEKMEGVFIGWYYAALMSGNKDAAQVAWELKCSASIALQQICEILNEKLE